MTHLLFLLALALSPAPETETFTINLAVEPVERVETLTPDRALWPWPEMREPVMPSEPDAHATGVVPIIIIDP